MPTGQLWVFTAWLATDRIRSNRSLFASWDKFIQEDTVNRKRPYRWRRTLWALAASTIVSSGVYADNFATTTPIKHIVVIFNENITFDHYFATYPHAANPTGEPAFVAGDDTPSVNGLSGALLTYNPNGANPERLDRSQAITCSVVGTGPSQHNSLVRQEHGRTIPLAEVTADGVP